MIKLTDHDHKIIADYFKQNYGIDLSEKKTFIESRLGYDIKNQGFETFQEFLKVALGNKSSFEHENMINKLTTNHTFFLRENNHFEYLKNIILPNVEKKYKERDLRIWSAGCSSGEEPYTIAMSVRDYFGIQVSKWDTRILATDISSDVLKKAISGYYNKDSIEALPTNWYINYFKQHNESKYEINDVIKDMVIFRIFNLNERDFPFKRKFHVIFCRNVMIYFDTETRKKLIQKFYNHLEDGGYLIIGHSETFPKDWANFEYLTTSIYRKGYGHNE